MIMLMLTAALAGPTLAEKTGTARSPLATPPVMVGCDATDLGFTKGATADGSLQQRAIEASGASVIRIVRTGEAITQDQRIDRLNLELDESNKVVSASCY